MMVEITEKIEFCKEVGSQFPGARVYYREEWDCWYFDLAGKYFALMSKDPGPDSYITLKNLPDKNVELRELYPAIRPGYYTSKKHWNSITLTDDDITESLLQALLQESYDLVFAGLTKKLQKELLESK